MGFKRFVLLLRALPFVVKQIGAFSRCSRTDTTSPWSARVHKPPAQEQYSDTGKHQSVGEPVTL